MQSPGDSPLALDDPLLSVNQQLASPSEPEYADAADVFDRSVENPYSRRRSADCPP